MNGRKSVIGIAVLCALAFSAFAAANASAEQKAFLCSTSATTKDYNDAHCVTNIGGGGSRGHVAIVGSANITGTNAATSAGTSAAEVSKLKGALSGVVTEVQCTGLSGTGTLTNETTFVKGTGVINYSGCTVAQPAGKGCVVTGGSISTKNLAATTSGQAANSLKFEPAPGETKFAEIPISGCSIGSLNNTFPVTGSLVATTNGATTTTTHAGITAQGNLKFGGVKAGLEGALTISQEGGAPVTLT